MAIDKKEFTKTKYQNIKIHNDGITFWFDFEIAKKRYRRLWKSNPVQTKADRLRSAQTHLELFRKEVLQQETLVADANATIDDYWEILKTNKAKKWSKLQMDKNKSYYDKYIKNVLGTKCIKDVKPAIFTKFNTTISHLATRTQKMAYELLVPIFNLAIEDEVINSSPIRRSHIPKRKQLEEKKVVTNAIQKYKAVHKAIHKVYKDNPHHRAIFLFGFNGRRRNEVLNLHWEDIDFDNDSYIIRATSSKVNIDMTFQLPADVKSALLEFRGTKGRIFSVSTITQRYEEVRKECKIPEFTFHWMRNLAVSALSADGVEITHLSAMLGHTDSGTIRKYLSLQREESTKATNEASKRLLGHS